MSNKYEKPLEHWNNVFGNIEMKVPKEFNTGNEELNNGIRWLAENSNSVLDFGCGHGTLLFCCGFLGCHENHGIDMCEKAIDMARKRADHLENASYTFEVGSLDNLKKIDDKSYDAVLISNVLDNLYPDDAEILLRESYRILKENGKILIKLNPLLSDEIIKQYEIKVIEGNLLDDGMILWNNTDKDWENFIGKYFDVVEYSKVFYKEYETENRLYKAIKK